MICHRTIVKNPKTNPIPQKKVTVKKCTNAKNVPKITYNLQALPVY